MRNLNTQLFFNRPLDFKQAWVTKLHDALRFQIDEMVVLAELVGAFVLRTVVPKLVFDDQAAVEQQVDGVVQSGSADTVLVVFHAVIQRVDVEMPIGGVDFLQDGKTLRGLAQLPPL